MELKQYLKPLRKWWWLIVAATLVSSVSSYLSTRLRTPQYRASATLMIGQAIENPNPTGNEFFLGQQLAQTYADIAQRQPVRQGTMEALGLTWLPAYSVRVLPNNQLVEISVIDSSPVRSQAVANTLAEQLIRQSPTSSQQEEQQRQLFINQQLDNLEADITNTEEEITTLRDSLASMVSARQIADTENQVRALQIKLNSLQTNYATLVSNSSRGAINSLAIIERANIPQFAIATNVPMTIALGAAIGFILSAGAAFLMEYLDDTIKTPDDVEQVTNLPTLAGIARVKMASDEERKLITLDQPRSPISEAYRVLRTSVLFSTVDSARRILLVSSANPTEGKSSTVANLGVVMAQAGNKVLIVDCDLRRPVQHKVFDLQRDQGLTNLLLEFEPTRVNGQSDALFETMIQETSETGLSVLASGPIPPNPSELLGSAKMAKLLELLGERFDFILIDSPPALAVTDSAVLSTRADSVMLIADSGRTRRNQLQQAVEQFREVNANVIGVTLNRLTPRSDGYQYYYYYRSSYYTESGSDNGSGDATPPKGRRRFFNGRRQKQADLQAETE